MRKRLLPLALVLVAAAACGADDQASTVPTPGSEPASGAPETSEAFSSPTTDPPEVQTDVTAPATTQAPPVEDASSLDPTSILPTIDDLPAGWSPVPNEEDDGDDSCFDPAFEALGIDSLDGPNSATATFSQSEFGPFLSSSVVLDSGDQVADGWDQLPDAFAACDGTPDNDGNIQRVLPVSFPEIGDDTFATRVDLEGGFPVSVLFVMARSGDDTVINVSAAFGGAPDAELVQSVTEDMIAKL